MKGISNVFAVFVNKGSYLFSEKISFFERASCTRKQTESEKQTCLTVHLQSVMYCKNDYYLLLLFIIYQYISCSSRIGHSSSYLAGIFQVYMI